MIAGAALILSLLSLLVAAAPDRWWCRVFKHRPSPGLDREECIAYLCSRCNRLVVGDFAARRRRR